MNAKLLPGSIQEVIKALSEATDLSPQKIKGILVAANVTEQDLLAWADDEHSPADSYGRQLMVDGGFYEIMVMTWLPGDYSAIHDHGYTVWGAVQVFGPAEHAVFAIEPEKITTLNRTRLTPGRVLAVSHELVHQMGNPTNERFLSLHVYGNKERNHGITADARVFALTRGEVQWTDGGVFYSLPEQAINQRAPAPSPDYYTWIFDLVQHLLRDRRSGADLRPLLDEMTDPKRWEELKADLLERMDEHRHLTDSRYWTQLYAVFRQAAKLQDELLDGYTGPSQGGEDPWRNYAHFYDRVIGTTNAYLPHYLDKVFQRYSIDPKTISFIDVGCGTGWLEQEMINRFGMNRNQLLGVDPSPAMLEVARSRTNVRLGGLLDLNESFGTYSVTFCNTYQYQPHEDFEESVGKMASITQPGGLCIGEFITQDHIRWYPNLVIAEDDTVLSLRNPSLHERDGYTYQASEIINVSRSDRMRITHEGIHSRFMISPKRVFEVFEKYFGKQLEMFDAISMEPIPLSNETCRSTRYLICAKQPG